MLSHTTNQTGNALSGLLPLSKAISYQPSACNVQSVCSTYGYCVKLTRSKINFIHTMAILKKEYSFSLWGIAVEEQ